MESSLVTYTKFYTSYHEAMEGLSDEQYGKVSRAINNYALYGKEPDLTGVELIIFTMAHTKRNGKYHWNWKGGITNENHQIRESADYKHWIKAVFIRDDFICQKCGKKGGKLNAHHIKKFSKYPELRFVINNGVTLCESCHKKQHKENGGYHGE
jgi:hypothetical protein